MKKLNENPFAWFILVVVLGYVSVAQGEMENFIVLGFAVVVAKLIEIINRLRKD